MALLWSCLGGEKDGLAPSQGVKDPCLALAGRDFVSFKQGGIYVCKIFLRDLLDSLLLTLEYELNSSAIACWGDGAFDSGPRRNCKQHCSNKALIKVGSPTGQGKCWLSKWLELYGIIGASTPWGRRLDQVWRAYVFYNLGPFKAGI